MDFYYLENYKTYGKTVFEIKHVIFDTLCSKYLFTPIKILSLEIRAENMQIFV